MFKKRFILGSFVLAALALTAADASLAQSKPEATEEFHQTYPLGAGGRVSLQNINGAVKVVAWDRAEVKVDAVKRAYTAERLREAQIRVDASAGRVRIETEYPDSTLTWNNRDGERHNNPATVEYTLTVPRGATIDEINLVNGDLALEGLAGSVEASSVNGRVTATGLTGPVQLSVVNGRLEATLDALGDSGRVTLSAVNGPLVVTLPSDANATLQADTVHGGITNDFNLPVRVGEYVGRQLQGRLGGGAARVRLNNVNGPIQIRRANDGRQPSAVTNLLSETRGRGDIDANVEVEVEIDEDDIKDAEREAARETSRERARDDRERQREQREMQRDIERVTREATLAAAEATREAARASRLDETTSAAIREGLKEAGKAGAIFDTARASARASARESKSYPVSGAPRVRVETFDGAINVHAWDKPEVMYTAVKRATDERELQGIKLSAQATGGEVTLRAEFDKSFAHVYREQAGRVTSYSSNASAEFDLYVPRNTTLSVSTGDGRLRIDGVTGELDIRTGDGPIDVTGARGKLRAETGDGRIRVDNFDGDADTRTGDGRITLDGNFRSLSARTGDGTISLTLPEGANATVETNAESVINDGVAVAETDGEPRVRRWRVGSGGQVLTLRTGEGQIILRRR
ncbi:MAG TPA: DUF4097 family beta strand repeat-containing protein [Pyrinomonadaceae bacterium]|jgi:DUF4097 and DUF4098 domain-containing protein YvlB